MKTIIFLMLAVQACVCHAEGTWREASVERQEVLQPLMQKVRSRGNVTDPEEFLSELQTAQQVYSYIQKDYGKALGLQSKETWDDMTGWYKLASQEVSLLSQRAAVLSASCRAKGGGWPKEASGETAKTLSAAEKTLKFMNTAPWGESLRKAVFGEKGNNEQAPGTVQSKAVKEWKKLKDCISGKGGAVKKKNKVSPD